VQDFQNKLHRIINGDAVEELKNLPTASVNLVFADPPYNIGKKYGSFLDSWENDEEYVNWCKQWIDECIRILKPNGSFYLMTSTQSMPFLDLFLRKKIDVLSRIVWCYDSSGVQAKKYYGSLYEPILFGVKDKNNTYSMRKILKLKLKLARSAN